MSAILDRDVVLAAFGEDRTRILKIKELGERLDIDHTLRSALRQLVRVLVEDGDLLTHPGRRFSLAAEGTLLEGRVQRHKRGFAWLLPDDDGIKDAFLPPEEAAGLLDGDRVLCSISPAKRGPVGKVIKVLARSKQALIGTLRRDRRATWVELEDGMAIMIPGGDKGGATDISDGSVVEVLIEHYPTPVTSAVGRIVRTLGKEGNIAVEVERLISAGSIVRPFSPEAEAEAAALPAIPTAADREGRRDLTRLPLCTIDGASAKDFDDAVYAEEGEGDRIKVIVAIADVAHYVKEGSALDADAQGRGTSLYYPGHCIPMLPEALSNGLCSLNPDVPRLCTVCEFQVSKQGRLSKIKLDNGVMQSQARLTYERVQHFFDGDKAEHEAIPAAVQSTLHVLRDAARRLRKNRKERGSMDFDLPESHVITDEAGEPVAIATTERHESHRLIEDLMIAANEAVASHLEDHDLPCVYRIHEPPDPEKLDKFLKLARRVATPTGNRQELLPGDKRLGKAKGKDAGKGQPPPRTSKALSGMLASLKGHRLKSALDFLMLRAMMQARYSAFNVGHFGLGSEAYAHFTSPIRRYPDLMVHRQIKAHLRHPRRRMKGDQLDDAKDGLEGLAAQCSELERRAMDVERKIDSLFCAWFMRDRVGDTFTGNVSGCAEFAVFVRLDDPEVEGSVHVAVIGQDEWMYDELQMRLTGRRSGYSVGVGDRVEVQIAKVDLAKRRIELSLLRLVEHQGVPTDIAPPGFSKDREDSARGPEGGARRREGPAPGRRGSGGPPGQDRPSRGKKKGRTRRGGRK